GAVEQPGDRGPHARARAHGGQRRLRPRRQGPGDPEDRARQRGQGARPRRRQAAGDRQEGQGRLPDFARARGRARDYAFDQARLTRRQRSTLTPMSSPSQPRSSPLRTILGYVLILGATVPAYWFIRQRGLHLTAPEP